MAGSDAPARIILLAVLAFAIGQYHYLSVRLDIERLHSNHYFIARTSR